MWSSILITLVACSAAPETGDLPQAEASRPFASGGHAREARSMYGYARPRWRKWPLAPPPVQVELMSDITGEPIHDVVIGPTPAADAERTGRLDPQSLGALTFSPDDTIGPRDAEPLAERTQPFEPAVQARSVPPSQLLDLEQPEVSAVNSATEVTPACHANRPAVLAPGKTETRSLQPTSSISFESQND